MSRHSFRWRLSVESVDLFVCGSKPLLLLRQGRIVALSPGVEPEQVSDANAMVQHAVIVIETGDDWVWRVAMADRGALARLEHQFEQFLWLPS